MRFNIIGTAFVLCVAVSVCRAGTNNWWLGIQLGQANGQQYGMHTIGMTNGASDSWDAGIDVLSYPNAIIGTAWLSITTNPPYNRLSKDCRAVTGDAEWHLTVQPSIDDNWRAQWDASTVPPNATLTVFQSDSAFTQQLSGPIDMLVSNQLTITSNAASYYVIRYAPPLYGVLVEITLSQAGGQQFGIQTLGTTNGASDGWDSGIDVLRYPDSIIGKAWFLIAGTVPWNKLSKDMRARSTNAIWKLHVQPSSDTNWIAQWSIVGLSYDLHLYWQETDSGYTANVGGCVDMTKTNGIAIAAGNSSYYRIELTSVARDDEPGPEPSDVEMFAARLANDYRTITLSWSNGAVNVLACTNRYYTKDLSQWFVQAVNTTSPWPHSAASNFASVYYRIVSSTFTSRYDVGKFDVGLSGGNGASAYDNDLSCPFAPFDPSLSSVFNGRLTPDSGFNRDIVFQGDGGALYARYNTNGSWNLTGGPAATNMQPCSRIVVRINKAHTNASSVTFVGMVPTVTVVRITIGRGNGSSTYDNWKGWPYPTPMGMNESGITNAFKPDGGFNRDVVFQLNGAQFARYTSTNAWSVSGGSQATNFYPGRGYVIRIDETHQTGATNLDLMNPIR